MHRNMHVWFRRPGALGAHWPPHVVAVEAPSVPAAACTGVSLAGTQPLLTFVQFWGHPETLWHCRPARTQVPCPCTLLQPATPAAGQPRRQG